MEMSLKIGIVGAMLEEVSSIKQLMVVENETCIAGRVYLTGKINDRKVVVVFSRWGKVASASTTTTLINKFDVDFVLFTGVAGAVSKHLEIGDIVIGSGLYQHDMDARPFFEQYQIPLTNSIILSPNPTDVEKAKRAIQDFLNTIDISQQLLGKYSIVNPSVHIGLIASGDKFVTTANHIDLITNNQEDSTLAVEMEGAAVAQICEEYNIPYIVIRVISDKADHSAVIDFQSFINDIASNYASGILKAYLSLPG